MLHKFTCGALSFLLLWTNVAFAVQSTAAAAPKHGDESIGTHLESVFQRLGYLQSMLDRSQYDLDALLDSLDFDGEQLVQYVKQEIHFQAYQGVLRGPVGTLISRSGNALDQSLLLAKLLKDAGYDARIVHGKLAANEARTLLRGMAKDVSWPSAFRSPGELEQLVRRFLPKLPSDPEPFRKEMNRVTEEVNAVSVETGDKIKTINQALQKAMSKNTPVTKPGELEEKLIAELEDYFWVQYQLDTSSGWQSAHPVFPGSSPGDVQISESFKDEIPAELQHRIRLQAFIETKLGGNSTVTPLMSAWERPAANLAFKPQSLMLMPHTDFEVDGKLDLTAGLAKAKFFSLHLNGKMAPGGVVFTLDGLVGPPDALSGQGAFIAEISEKGLGAATALSGLGSAEKPSPGGLLRIWFEFSKIAPGGKVTTATRDVLVTTNEGEKLVHGRPVSEETWKSQLKLAMVQNRNIGVATGPVSPAYSMGQLISNSENAKKTIDSLRKLEAEGRLAADPEVMKGIEPLPDLKMVKFLSVANGDLGFQSGSASYLAAPMLATFNRGVSDYKGDLRGYEQTDIVFNARRSLDLSAQTIQIDSAGSSLMGVWDTLLETMPGAGKSPELQSSAFKLLESQTKDLQLLTPSQSSELNKLKLEPSALLLANNELEAGYGLIVSVGNSAENPAWWRVDMETGTVTGMALGPGGYGGISVTEFLALLSIGLGTLLMYISFYNCWENETGLDLFCCLVDSWITNILIAMVAFVIAQLLTAGIAAGAVSLGAEALAAAAEAELVSAIVAALIFDANGIVLSFTDFRLRFCETATGG